MTDITLEQLDPNELIIADNVRLDPKLDRGLIASIKARGVLTTIDAWRDAEGVHVLRGQRRTLAARQAGAATVPVAVSATRPEEADRLVDQWVENEHRAALTNSERIQAVEQMTLVGLSEAQIAKRTGTKRAAVKAAITAAGSGASRDAADMLTLEQAAALAEFDGDSEAIEALLFAAEDGQFDHALSRLRQDRAEAEAIASLTDQLRAEGKTMADERPGYGNDFTRPIQLDRLTDRDDKEPITEAEHTDCPGHAYYVSMQGVDTYSDAEGNALSEDEVDNLVEAESRAHAEADGSQLARWQALDKLNIKREWSRQAVAEPICAEPTRHSARYTYGTSEPKKLAADMTDDERQTAKAERQKVIANNKAWRAAEPVRREWLAEFATRKTAPKGAEAYVAAHALRYHDPKCVGRLDVIGLSGSTVEAELDTCTPKRALQLALIIGLTEWEASTSTDTWRRPNDVDRRTLRQLGEWGYTLSEVEAEVADS